MKHWSYSNYFKLFFLELIGLSFVAQAGIVKFTATLNAQSKFSDKPNEQKMKIEARMQAEQLCHTLFGTSAKTEILPSSEMKTDTQPSSEIKSYFYWADVVCSAETSDPRKLSFHVIRALSGEPSDFNINNAALQVLRQMGKDAVPAMVNVIKNDDLMRNTTIALAMARNLGNVGVKSEDVIDALEHLAQSKNARIAEAARNALEKLGR